MKSLLKILAPFGCAVVVIIVFYVLGLVFGVLSWLLNLDFLEDIMEFLWIFSGEYPTGSIVITIMVWIILTIFVEIAIESENE